MNDDAIGESGKDKQLLKDIKWVASKVEPSYRQADEIIEYYSFKEKYLERIKKFNLGIISS